jgi:hypothetical protein
MKGKNYEFEQYITNELELYITHRRWCCSCRGVSNEEIEIIKQAKRLQ